MEAEENFEDAKENCDKNPLKIEKKISCHDYEKKQKTYRDDQSCWFTRFLGRIVCSLFPSFMLATNEPKLEKYFSSSEIIERNHFEKLDIIENELPNIINEEQEILNCSIKNVILTKPTTQYNIEDLNLNDIEVMETEIEDMLISQTKTELENVDIDEDESVPDDLVTENEDEDVSSKKNEETDNLSVIFIKPPSPKFKFKELECQIDKTQPMVSVKTLNKSSNVNKKRPKSKQQNRKFSEWRPKSFVKKIKSLPKRIQSNRKIKRVRYRNKKCVINIQKEQNRKEHKAVGTFSENHEDFPGMICNISLVFQKIGDGKIIKNEEILESLKEKFWHTKKIKEKILIQTALIALQETFRDVTILDEKFHLFCYQDFPKKLKIDQVLCKHSSNENFFSRSIFVETILSNSEINRLDFNCETSENLENSI